MSAPRSAFSAMRYWRPVSKGYWHLYRNASLTGRGRGIFKSVCNMGALRPDGIGGNRKLTRPPVEFRCGGCDSQEIQLLGAIESLDESPNWKDNETNYA